MSLLVSLVGCDNSNNSNPISETESVFVEEELSGEIVELDVINQEDIFRFSSITDVFNASGSNTYKMTVPYDDRYQIYCDKASKVEIFNYQKILLDETTSSMTINLRKGQTVFVRVTSDSSDDFDLKVIPILNMAELPYEVNSSIDMKSLLTSGDNSKNPLQACDLSYTKRDDGKGLYVNCNNPEKLTTAELNTSLVKQDVTDKEVFFTFEHNNIDGVSFYYGYRVTNTDDHDIYVTVKNVGFQVSGAGSWLGEKEWIDFYNTKFYSDTSSFNLSQRLNYNAYVGFCNTYVPECITPTTYRIPSGKYIYVIGGTTKDAYNNINVFNTANIRALNGCGNGAVIFSVTGGSAQGSFLVYDDNDASTVNETDYVKGDNVYGYRATRNGVNVGSQYSGYDTCHGVVDADLTWTFNDATPSGALPVSYENPYLVSSNKREGQPLYSQITEFVDTKVYNNATEWYTHINPNNVAKAVGTDMTQYINVDYESKEEVILNYLNYDGRGKTMNIGNWMMDYIDTFTLINQGNNEREFTYSMTHSGVILAFVRDENGLPSEYYIPKYATMISKSDYGAAIDDRFTYTIKVPAHSVIRFSVNYNLLANSNGCIGHFASLR